MSSKAAAGWELAVAAQSVRHSSAPTAAQLTLRVVFRVVAMAETHQAAQGSSARHLWFIGGIVLTLASPSVAMWY